LNGDYYAYVLKTHLRRAMWKKRPDLLKKKWFLLQNNTRPHIAAVALAALAEFGGTALKHPPYSPDLAPCDFSAFPTLKRQLGGKRFSSDDEVRNATASVLKGSGRPDHNQQHSYHHAPTVKPEAATAVVEFLMMGVRTPETC